MGRHPPPCARHPLIEMMVSGMRTHKQGIHNFLDAGVLESPVLYGIL